jgi:small-conductance mechanosensitive channel
MSSKMTSFAEGFFLQLPNIVAAIIFFGFAWIASQVIGKLVTKVAQKRNRPDLGNLLSSLARGAILITAALFATAIIFPSVNPGDIFTTLGIGSVAIGFAFKDILQNLLAGLLLLIRRPYKRGDQIVVKDFEGTVEQIESRATLIKTYDGRRVIIPNSDVYTSPVVVNTAFDARRDEFVVGIGYGDDMDKAISVFETAMTKVDGVLADPAPEILPFALNDSTVDLKARWWANSTRSEQVHVRSRVVVALYNAAKANNIDLPFPTQVLLFHDQTETTDGDRNAQREGWPGGDNAPAPVDRNAQKLPVTPKLKS